jgi:predicted nucleic acid-binding protein
VAAEPRPVLLDTGVLIAPPAAGFASIPGAATVSSISVAELEFGVDTPADLLARRVRRSLLDAVVAGFDIVPFDHRCAASYGLLANLVRAAGRNPRPRRLDLLIAATAHRHGLALATRNVADFRHLDRVLEIVEVT